MAIADVTRPNLAARPPRATPAAWSWIARVARWGLAAAVVVGVVIGVARYRNRHTPPPLRFESAQIDRGEIDAKVTATGALSALVTVSVGSQVSGRIQALYADFESTVKAGQVIAKIDPALFDAAVAQARANHTAALANVEHAQATLANAEKQLARAKLLVSQGLMGQADFDTAESTVGVARADVKAALAAVGQAKAGLEQAELNLRYTTIVSPIDGVVISRNVDVGQTVAAALAAPTIFTIAKDLTRMQVDSSVAEGDVGHVTAKMDVTFTVDAFPDRVFHGVVRQVRDNAQTLQNVVTYDAVIDVANDDRLLRPGMTANTTFVYARRPNALRLPNAALRFRPDSATLATMTSIDAAAAIPKRDLHGDERIVWLLRAGRPVAAVVHIGVSDGMATELVDGDLREHDAVIVEAIATTKGA